MKVYVTWIGTDNSGRYLLSDNYRLSNFEDYSISSLYSSAKGIGSSIYNYFSSF